MDVSVILVNYNTLHLTKDCIDSIFEKTQGISFEIILVDNDSQDGSQKYFSEDKRIVFVESGGNIGFGRANNLGVKKATGKYIFFLNTDTLLVNNAIKCFFDYCEEHSHDKLGGIGCLLQDKEGNTIHSFAHFPTLTSKLRDFLVAPIYKKLGKTYQRYDTTDDDVTKDSFRVDYVTGADLFVSRELIDKCGAFDKDFFMYFEETEMQHRWTRNGYPSYILKSPKIIHLEGGSVNKDHEQFNPRQFIMGINSAKVYMRKTHGTIYNFAYRIVNLLNIYVVWHHHFDNENKKKAIKAILK